MSASPNQSTQGAAGPSGQTAAKVIEMFTEDLCLPVCDDGAAIDKAVKDQLGRRMREKNHPTPSVSAKAQQWFRNVDALQNRRPELVKIVYEAWTDLVDFAMESAFKAGATSLDQSQLDRMLGTAKNQFKTDDALASCFIQDYMVDRNLTVGGPLVKLAPVQDFAATSGLGKIELTWKMPMHCRSVRIERQQTAGARGRPASGGPRELLEDSRTSYDDTDVEAGAAYTYTATPIYENDQPGPKVSRSGAICLGEVANVKATLREGAIRLSWDLPGDNVSTLIFKRAGAAPAVQCGAHGPRVTDEATRQFSPESSHATTWQDSEYREGMTYHYLIVADFGLDRYSRGVACQVKVPKPPSAVPELTATYKQSGDDNVIDLRWRAVRFDVQVRYAVVRREGDVPPGSPSEGEIVRTTAQTSHLDQDVEPGKRYSYAVFALAGNVYSRSGAAAPRIDVLPDVTSLGTAPGDGIVELSWKTPRSARATVYRSVNPPRGQSGETLVPLTGPDRAKDTGLRNGRTYHYLVRCEYPSIGQEARTSAGVRVVTSPQRLPDPVAEFKAEPQGTEVVCTWRPPDHGQATVVRTVDHPEFRLGHRLSARQVDQQGQHIAETEPGKALDSHPNVREPWYSIYTLAGAHAVFGGCQQVVVAPDVTELRVTGKPDGTTLRWRWPSGCTSVVVARREGGWPDGPADPKAERVPCSRVDYANAGEKHVDSVRRQGHYYYIVYARPSGTRERVFSPGTGPGCRAEVLWAPRMTLRYSIEEAGSSGRGDAMLLTFSIEDAFKGFAGFALRADQGWVPGPTDGVKLVSWTPKQARADVDEARVWVPLAKIRQKRWDRFFCKAHPLDPAQAPAVLIVHPDTCRPFTSKGKRAWQAERGRRGVLKRKPPRTYTCPNPQCLHEFPVEEMLFGSFEGKGEPQTGRHGLLSRIRGLPPQPPMDSSGKRLTRKLCPNPMCRQDLPWTAGTQESLLIGLVGAKSSGKTHYITSLIRRLQTQVGDDLSMSCTHCTDDTRRRYNNEFYKPLFQDKTVFPQTVGTPPPLIYDLTFDGSLWNSGELRSVALVLYDTAGENFNDPQNVRTTVQHLRIASGVIFIIDPLQVQAIRDAVPESVPKPQLNVEGDPSQVLTNVLAELENGKVVGQNQRLTTPVAVVLTKCDVLRDAGLIDPNRLWTTDKRHIGAFDDQAQEDMNGMMGELVHRWCSPAYHIIMTRFSRHAFFGVSATGCAPDRKNCYKYVSPWRVEDPLLWLLAEQRVIPVK